MEISTAAPPSLSLQTNTTTPKSADADQAEIPTTRIPPTKSLPFTNGVLKHHPLPHLHRHHNQQTPATTAPPVSYKECMKNHAATMGGHALDGCGEFMPSPTAVATDPTSLKCAACGCHRNFHRRETPGAAGEDCQPQPLAATPSPTTHVIEYHPHHRHHPPPPPSYGIRSPNSQSPPPISSSYYPTSAPHMLLALSGGGGSHPSAAMEALHSPHSTTPFPQSRKRFRTKFTQFQKEKMHEFAEKLGWKMQKISEDMVVEFCNEVGVERGVFKVWMHNNKNTSAKRDLNGNVHTSTGIDGHTTPTTVNINDNNGSSGNSGNNESGNGSHGYSKNGDGAYGSSTSS